MADHQQHHPSSTSKTKVSPGAPPRPTISLPPRPYADVFFNGGGPGTSAGLGMGFSPGPMTLVSSFFSDSDDCKSFSQLLAGAMASPAAQQRPAFPPLLPPDDKGSRETDISASGGDGARSSGDLDRRFKQSRPTGLVIAQPPSMFTVPPGLSPATLLDPPGFGLFSPGPFGMTHQQALMQVTAQAAQANYNMQVQAEHLSPAPAATLGHLPSTTVNTNVNKQMAVSVTDTRLGMESSELSLPDHRPQPASFTVDKPADDGYNWRKYGQKQVKGSEFPRSYYKCTHPSCPVKKKVERSLDGQITEIIYKGQHNHQPPQSNKRAKDTSNSYNQGNSEFSSQSQSDNFSKSKEGASAYSIPQRDQELSHPTPEHVSCTSDSEYVGDVEAGTDEKDEDEPEPKRRSMEGRVSEPASSHRTVTEPRIIVQTTSEVDLLDDGYRWRKYGQKVVKGNPYPRSYYKCTTQGCNVRKHVERASADPKAVITTYEGKHNHDIPAAKSSSHNTAISNASQVKPQNVVGEKHAKTNSSQQPIARLRLKEEQIT